MKFIKIPNKDFEIQIAPLTQFEWKEIMGNNPSYFKNKPNNPVETVSWNDCQEFIKKLNKIKDGYNYRLPEELEWEYCCEDFNEKDLDKNVWFYKNSNNQTQPIMQKLPNKFGLYDMLGNVWEWCQSPYLETKGVPDYEHAQYRVFRGGSWNSNARFLRSAYRSYCSPGNRLNSVGFRLVRTITLDSFTILPLEKK